MKNCKCDTERDYEFEKNYGFDSSLDYIKELQERNRLIEARDLQGWHDFLYKHKGDIAFFGKLYYYIEIKKAGLL